MTEAQGPERGWSGWGKAVGDALTARNLTVNAAAAQLGIRNTTLGKWLDGLVPPRLDVLPAIAQLTGISHLLQLSLGGVLPESLHADAHTIQVAEELRAVVGTLDQVVHRASELAFTDAGARLAGVLLSRGQGMQVTLRRASRGRRYPIHLSTYVGIDDFGDHRRAEIEDLRKDVTKIVGDSSTAFGARWREQDAHDWEPPRPRLILNVPQHERPRPPSERRLSAAPNFLMLGCPYAHAEFVGALLAESLGYGYHDVRYSVTLPLDRSPTDAAVTDARTNFTKTLMDDDHATSRHVWSITDHRVIPNVIESLGEAAVACAIYVRSEDRLLERGGEVWGVDAADMFELRDALDAAVANAPWPCITVTPLDSLLQVDGDGRIDKDRLADVATLAAADVWAALATRGLVPPGNLALGSIHPLFDERGRLQDLRPSLVTAEQRMPPKR